MPQKYEYKFVRLGESNFFHIVSKSVLDEYQEVIHEHAREGWRLVQILIPPMHGFYGRASFVELILEREVG